MNQQIPLSEALWSLEAAETSMLCSRNKENFVPVNMPGGSVVGAVLFLFVYSTVL